MWKFADWIMRRQSKTFLEALIETKGAADEIADAQAQRVLMEMRLQNAVAPYTTIFKLIWEIIRGKYWRAGSKIRGSANQASGGGAGTVGQPVAQFTGPAGFTAAGLAAAGFNPFPQASSPGLMAAPAPAPAPVMDLFSDAGIVAGEVTAFRCWRLRDGLLCSCFMHEVVWKPGKIMEGDAASGDGVHAFKSRISALKYGVGYTGDYGGSDVIVSGTVELWGDVYEHTRGYRASKAAIKSIDDSLEYDAPALRKLYGLNKRKKASK